MYITITLQTIFRKEFFFRQIVQMLINQQNSYLYLDILLRNNDKYLMVIK